MSRLMHYGPDWPPRESRPKTRGDRMTYNMLIAALLMLGWLALWRASAPMQLNLTPDAPPTTYATTTVHPVAGGGQTSHQPHR